MWISMRRSVKWKIGRTSSEPLVIRHFFASGAVFFRRSRLFVLFHPTQPHPCKPHQIKQPLSKIAVFLSINESALPPSQPSSAKNVPITRRNVQKKHTFPRLIPTFLPIPSIRLAKKMGCGISLKDTTAFYGLLSTLERLNGGRW